MTIYTYLTETGDRRSKLYKVLSERYDSLCEDDFGRKYETEQAKQFANRLFDEALLTKEFLNPITPQSIESFFTQPGINLTGVCQEAGITKQYLNRCRKDKVLPGPKVMEKLVPVMKKYGF